MASWVATAAIAFAPPTQLAAAMRAVQVTHPNIVMASWNDAYAPVTNDPTRSPFVYGPVYAEQVRGRQPGSYTEYDKMIRAENKVYGAAARQESRAMSSMAGSAPDLPDRPGSGPMPFRQGQGMGPAAAQVMPQRRYEDAFEGELPPGAYRPPGSYEPVPEPYGPGAFAEYGIAGPEADAVGREEGLLSPGELGFDPRMAGKLRGAEARRERRFVMGGPQRPPPAAQYEQQSPGPYQQRGSQPNTVPMPPPRQQREQPPPSDGPPPQGMPGPYQPPNAQRHGPPPQGMPGPYQPPNAQRPPQPPIEGGVDRGPPEFTPRSSMGRGAMCCQVSGLDMLLGDATEEVKQAALDWCNVNQVADMGILFDDPMESDNMVSYFLDHLPLNPQGIYDKTLRKRLNELKFSS